MKRFILVIFSLMITALTANAATQIKVSAVNEFRTDAPTDKIDVKIASETELGDTVLNENDILHCSVVKIDNPKRGKRDAVFYVKADSFSNKDGKCIKINEDYYGKYSKTVLSVEELKKIPPFDIAKKAVLTVGNHFVKGLSTGVYFVEGVVENEESNRIKSGAKNAYDKSYFSYAGKGQQLDIKQGEEFYLIFKQCDSDKEAEEKPNYSYTQPANN